jgi:NAD(P)-dependent dehydrogenase (short-subunit alcohol dehydrogenase family)
MADEARVALVTGAGRSVGQGIALALAEAGHKVAVNDLHADRAASTVELIEAAGGSAVAFPFDVTNRSSVLAALHGIGQALGPVDILVNNAGIPEGFMPGPFMDSDPGLWHVEIDLNFYGSLNCLHGVLPRMVDQSWGRVIQISAGSAATGRNIGVSLYAAGKAATESLLRHVSYEVGQRGVTVNTFALGLMGNTRPERQENEAVRRLFDNVALQRYGTPAEIGAAAVWLCSDLGGYVTGQTIHLNGGSYNGR